MPYIISVTIPVFIGGEQLICISGVLEYWAAVKTLC